jgi:hypothetical protein
LELELACTITLYVPAGVPVCCGCELLMPAPPPHETVRNNSSNGASHRYRGQRSGDRFGRRTPGTNNIPREKVHNHDAGREDPGAEAGRGRAAVMRAVVTTLVVKVVGVVALKARVEGREQVEPAGAPVQEREAVPLIPSPPIERV